MRSGIELTSARICGRPWKFPRYRQDVRGSAATPAHVLSGGSRLGGDPRTFAQSLWISGANPRIRGDAGSPREEMSSSRRRSGDFARTSADIAAEPGDMPRDERSSRQDLRTPRCIRPHRREIAARCSKVRRYAAMSRHLAARWRDLAAMSRDLPQSPETLWRRRLIGFPWVLRVKKRGACRNTPPEGKRSRTTRW